MTADFLAGQKRCYPEGREHVRVKPEQNKAQLTSVEQAKSKYPELQEAQWQS